MRGDFTVLQPASSKFAQSVTEPASPLCSYASRFPPRGLLLTLTGVTCEERNHLKCHDKYFTAADDEAAEAAAAERAAEVVFLAANIGGTLLCGKEPLTRRERREKDTHGTAAPEEGADMRVVQCLIHASAVSDSGSSLLLFL